MMMFVGGYGRRPGRAGKLEWNLLQVIHWICLLTVLFGLATLLALPKNINEFFTLTEHLYTATTVWWMLIVIINTRRVILYIRFGLWRWILVFLSLAFIVSTFFAPRPNAGVEMVLEIVRLVVWIFLSFISGLEFRQRPEKYIFDLWHP